MSQGESPKREVYEPPWKQTKIILGGVCIVVILFIGLLMGISSILSVHTRSGNALAGIYGQFAKIITIKPFPRITVLAPHSSQPTKISPSKATFRSLLRSTVTSTPTPFGKVLYQADFTNRLSDWTFDSTDYRIVDGMLEGTNVVATLHYPLPVSDYTVTSNVIVLDPNMGGFSGRFGINIRYYPSSPGEFMSDEIDLMSNGTNFLALSLCPQNACAGPTSVAQKIVLNQELPLVITGAGTHISISGLGRKIDTEDTQKAPVPGSIVVMFRNMEVRVKSLMITSGQ